MTDNNNYSKWTIGEIGKVVVTGILLAGCALYVNSCVNYRSEHKDLLQGASISQDIGSLKNTKQDTKGLTEKFFDKKYHVIME
jgi:hypothetical protein